MTNAYHAFVRSGVERRAAHGKADRRKLASKLFPNQAIEYKHTCQMHERRIKERRQIADRRH